MPPVSSVVSNHMIKNILVLILFIFIYISACADGKEANDIFGTWTYPSTEVYLIIEESGIAFQCRIATDLTTITAIGKVLDNKAIEWEPVIAKSKVGELLGFSTSGKKFSWGKDLIIMEGSKLTLEGKFGSFSFVRNEKDIHPQCINWLKIANKSPKPGTPHSDAP